jgi:hypothetical protein
MTSIHIFNYFEIIDDQYFRNYQLLVSSTFHARSESPRVRIWVCHMTALRSFFRNRPFSSVRAVVWCWRLWIDCNVAMLGFLRGMLATFIGVGVRWFTFVNHGKFLDLITGNLYKELWKARTTLLFDGNIVCYCYMSLLRHFAIGKLHAP